MLSKVKCVAFHGLQVIDVDVEVNVTRGIPSFEIVGLPNKAIEESKYRIKSAFQNCGFEFADSRIVVNLAPASILKVGSIYDLPIAVGIFCSKNKLSINPALYFFGELSLDGSVRNTRGLYLALDYVCNNKTNAFVPKYLAELTNDLDTSSIYFVSTMTEIFNHLLGKHPLAVAKIHPNFVKSTHKIQPEFLITDVVGQDMSKRALQVAAAGGHNLMLLGSPGTGKSMLAKSILSILPPLSNEEVIAIRKIHSYCNQNLDFTDTRPFRSPHHTISYAGMVGGGNTLMPGEVTLAHKGVLFMDEFCEFSRNVLEALRQPLQDKYTVLTRNNMTYTFPSDFSLIAASNPCPCGYLGHEKKACICSEQKIFSYTKKLSGPLADRFDMFVPVFPEEGFLTKVNTKVDSRVSLEQIKTKVYNAKQLQLARISKLNLTKVFNMSNEDILSYTQLDSATNSLLNETYTKLNLSPRAYYKILKLARTIADLESCTKVKIEHLAEALQFRQR